MADQQNTEQPHVLTYPYLARETFDEEDDYFVVLFTSENKGVVVVDHTKVDHGVKFGEYGRFMEEQFDILPPDIVVRLGN